VSAFVGIFALPPEDTKVAYKRGRLNAVAAVPNCPSCTDTNRNPSGGIDQARQAFAALQNHPQDREWSFRVNHELIRRRNGESVVNKSKVDNMDATRSNPTAMPETGHSSERGLEVRRRL